jgi:hypothetical protein
MSGKKGMSWAWWKWFPQDFMAAVSPLDLDTTGAWINCICSGMLNKVEPGAKEGRLVGLAKEWRVGIDRALEMCFELASTGIADVEMDMLDGGWKGYSNALAAELHGKTPNPFWGVKIVCRRVRKDAAKRENEKNGGKTGDTADMDNSEHEEGGEPGEIPFLRDDIGGDAGRNGIKNARKKQKQILIPPTPFSGGCPGHSRMTVSEKKHTFVKTNSEAMIRFGAWFGRKADTRWTVAEAEALDAWLDGATVEDIEVVEKYYLAARRFGRDAEALRKAGMFPCREPSTMFNKWARQVEMAREWQAGQQASGKSYDGKIE